MKKGVFQATSGATLFLLLAILPGCAGTFQGIKVRAQAPAIDEAFRKLTLAVTADGYSIISVDPSTRTLESGWRDLAPKEMSDADRSRGDAKIEGMIRLRMDVRGRLYDVFLTPVLRYAVAGKGQEEVVAAVRHPLREKWELAIMRLLEREAKEED